MFIMKQVVAILVCLLMPSEMLWAGDGNHYDFTPKSPEAAAFNRISDIPMNNYTGSMSFSIPIYILVCGDIQVPISLDYQGNCIPVSQEATWVGLNWLLNAGGVITATLSTTSTYYGETFKKDWNYMLNSVSMERIPLDGEFPQILYKMDGEHPDWRGSHGKRWFKQTLEPENLRCNGDLSRQLYYYILDKKSGETPTYHATFLDKNITYVWDRLKDEFFIIGRNQGLQIQGTPAIPTIIDGKGFKYTFRDCETAGPEGYLVDTETTSRNYTFFLSQIESPSGRTVKFKYVPGGGITTMYHVDENLYSKEYPIQAIGTSYRNTTTLNGNTLDRSISQLYTVNTLRLSEIEADNVVVKFVPSNKKREDLDGDSRALSRIEIYQKENGKRKLMKSFYFSYSYFSKNETGGNTVRDLFQNNNQLDIYQEWFPSDEFMYKRLRLDSFWEESPTGNQTNKYSFGYYGDLPCKASAAVDYWGYYNGCENFTGVYHTLLPKQWGMGTSDVEKGFPISVHYDGADRRFNETYATAGMLGSIIYPTGCRKYITFEGHRFGNFTYLEMGRNSLNDKFSPVSIYATNQEYGKVLGSTLNEATFRIYDEGIFKVSLNYTLSNEPKAPSWRNVLSHPILLYHYGTYYDRSGPHEVVTGCDVLSVLPSDTVGVSSLSVSKQLRLSSGKYKLEIAGGNDFSVGDYPYEYYKITGGVSLSKSLLSSKGGGLRVKSITTNDNGNESTWTYHYENFDGRTSGQLMSPALFARRKLMVFQSEYYQKNEQNIGIDPHTAKLIQYAVVSGNNAVPNPPFVGYDRVTISHENEEVKNGSEVLSFRNRRWGTTMLERCKEVKDPRNGMQLSDSVFDANGNLVKVTKNDYKWKCVDSRLLSAVIENIYVGENAVTESNGLISTNAYAEALGGGCMQMYLYPSVQFSLLSSKSKTWDFAKGVTLISERETKYNQSNCLDSIVVSTQSESDVQTSVETFYPQDATSNSSFKELSKRHFTDLPIERVSSLKDENGTHVMDSQRFLYDENGNITKEFALNNQGDVNRGVFPLLKDTYSFDHFYTNASLTYNSAGNPREVRDAEGGICTYIWGYCNTYPIAVVKGCDFAAVCGLLGGETYMQSLENAEIPNFSPRELYDKLKKKSYLNVTTYGFTPHVGMIEMISPNGESTTYTYDGFCRLSSVIDQDGIVANSYKYHLKR